MIFLTYKYYYDALSRGLEPWFYHSISGIPYSIMQNTCYNSQLSHTWFSRERERERKHSREFYKKISQELKFTWNFPICFPRDLLDAVENKEISREFHAGHNCLQYNRQKTLIRLTVHVYKFKFSFEKVNVCKWRSIMGTGNCGLKLHALRFRFAKITFVIQG